MVDDLLAKISAKSFFTTIGAFVVVGILSVIGLGVLLILLNFNILEWIE